MWTPWKPVTACFSIWPLSLGFAGQSGPFLHMPDSHSLWTPVQVAWLTVITQRFPILLSVPPAQNLPLQTKTCQFVDGRDKLSGRVAGARTGTPPCSSFTIQLAASAPLVAPIALSFLSLCLWPNAPLLAGESGLCWGESLQPLQVEGKRASAGVGKLQ